MSLASAGGANTGGQTSTASFTAQVSKMTPFGTEIPGKRESRKEIARIAMMHPATFVAQTTTAIPNHFYNAIVAANAYPGAALVNVYTTCQPGHGPFTFIDFALTEGRFARQFDAEGKPSEALRAAEEDRLANWHLLQELAGLK